MFLGFLKKDTVLLLVFLIAALLTVGYVTATVRGTGAALPVLASAVLCLTSLVFTFLTVGKHLKDNADELYGEEIKGGK